MFIGTNSPKGVKSYLGQPDCAAAYDWVLALLKETTEAWLAKPDDFSDRIKGNLGEFIAFHLTKASAKIKDGWYVFYANADTPLSRSSATGLDICLLFLGGDVSGIDDRLYIQEVKTTGKSDMTYGYKLIDDYKKLAEEDPSLNLQGRIRAIKARMRDLYDADVAILDRVQKLGHPEPSKCKKIILLPTVVHERVGAKPITVLLDISKKIADLGWERSRIEPRHIALSKLNEGLKSLATNIPFKP